MNDDGILDAEWGREAVAIVEKAIEEFNSRSSRPLMRVAWGEDTRFVEKPSADELPQQEGLLDCFETRFELIIRPPGEFNALCAWMTVRLWYGPLEFPLNRERFFRVFPWIGPFQVFAGPGIGESETFQVMGIQITLPVEILTWRVMNDAVIGLLAARSDVMQLV